MPWPNREVSLQKEGAVRLRLHNSPSSSEWKRESTTLIRKDVNDFSVADACESELLSHLEDGNRLVVWARVQFPGWSHLVGDISITAVCDLEALGDRPESFVSTAPEPWDLLDLQPVPSTGKTVTEEGGESSCTEVVERGTEPSRHDCLDEEPDPFRSNC